MPVLKSEKAGGLIKDAIVLDLGDVSRQAQRLREAAESKARRILLAAHEQANRVATDSHEQGYQAGFDEGLAKGLAQGHAAGRDEALQQANDQFQKIQQAWIDAAHQWESLRQAMDRDARHAVLDLVLQITKRIVHRVITTDPTVVVDQVATTLAHVLRPTEATISICAEDRPVLKEVLPELLAKLPQLQHVHLLDDPDLCPGGCVVSYGQGRIDASIETQLDRLVQLMIPPSMQAVPSPKQNADTANESEIESEAPKPPPEATAETADEDTDSPPDDAQETDAP